MQQGFDVPRAIRRVAPKQAATAAVYENGQRLAYGIVTNISVTGACIVTDAALEPGHDVTLKLSFYQEPDLFEFTARIMWQREGAVGEKGFEGLQLHGVRFEKLSAVWRARLHELLDGDSFYSVYQPATTEFDHLQASLAQELEKLGSRIHRTTGQKS